MGNSENERRHYWVEVLAGSLATLFGILVAGVGVIYTVNANSDNERDSQAAAAASQQQEHAASFELTAAQIVMSQRSCTLAAANSHFQEAHQAHKKGLCSTQANESALGWWRFFELAVSSVRLERPGHISG